MPKLPTPVIIAGVAALVVIVFLIAKGSGSKTITPTVPTASGTGSNNGATTQDISSLLQSNNQSILDAITSVQSQIASLPAGATNDQLNAALANLQSAMQAANNTSNAQTISNLQSALAGVQKALGTQNDQNTQALQSSISNLQQTITQSITQDFNQEMNAISGGFSGQNSFMQQQFSAIQNEFNLLISYLPKLSTTSNDPHSLYEALGGNGYWNAVNAYGGSSTQAANAFVTAIKQAFPGLQNVDYARIQDWYQTSGIQQELLIGGANTQNRTATNQTITQFFQSLVQQGYAQGA